METETIESVCNEARSQLKTIEEVARKLMNAPQFNDEQSYIGQYREMKSQIMLCVRHLEDARMRLGKVIQYSGDGVSVYDKPE